MELLQKAFGRAPGINWTGLLFHGLAIAFAVYVFVLGLRPLSDPDIWWHLATGRWIVENRALPGQEDPFSYTTPSPLSDSQVRGTRSQWLGQVVFYLVYLAGSYRGVAAFRALLIVLLFVYLYVRCARRGVHPLLALSCLGFPPLLMSLTLYNTFERPQAFSFVLALVLCLLLGKARKRGKGRWAWLVPPVMILWSNLHGGYIVGVVVICAYAAGEAAARLLGKTRFKARVASSSNSAVFLATCAAGIAVTAFNPGGYALLSLLLFKVKGLLGLKPAGAGGAVMAEILEYKPLWYFYRELYLKWPLYITGFYVAALSALALKYVVNRKIDFSEAFVGVFVVLLGLYYARGVNFALIVLALLASNVLVSMKGIKRAVASLASATVSLLMLVHLAWSTPWELVPRIEWHWVSEAYPERAVRFLEEHEVKGPMFNYLKWGGYLIWRAPGYKVFFDGREISSAMTRVYANVIRAAPLWEEILEAYDVNMLFVPLVNDLTGVTTPMILRMMEEKNYAWRPVYLKGNVAIFVRDVPANREVLECCGISFSGLNRKIAELADLHLISRPGHPGLLFSKAAALVELGMLDEAEGILSGLPPSTGRNYYLERIRQKRPGPQEGGPS